MSAFITRRGTSSGGDEVVTGTQVRYSAQVMKIPDLAGKSNFTLIMDDYALSSVSTSIMQVAAIYYLDGQYSVSCLCGEDLCEFTDSDSFDVLSFDNATGNITLNGDNIEEALRFKSSTYYRYVGW